MMDRMARIALVAAGVTFAGCAATAVMAHGNVVPQAVDTKGLKPLGDVWLKENPYRGDPLAIKVGMSAYNQNCARCHGLEGISGGIAPDLRYLEVGAAGDEWFMTRYQHGAVRDGKVYMPAFGPVIGQEPGWAIRSWLDTVHQE